MILKSLEMQGFKSFPDKTVLNFNDGITCVVGPNGSGKSNISDAVRWVLGEQSTKNLRGSKMEDVIFGGTNIRRALGFAEVSLILENKDRKLNIDKDIVKVTRRYYRSGDSDYLINGENVRLRDINELFMDTGLGRDGYSMVSQGRVADLISSKSNNRRDMLEEAAGISHYRYRRADASRKLAQAEENMVRLRDILAELEARVGPLKTQSEKAQKFLVYADEKKELEIGIWLHNIDKIRGKLGEQTDKIKIAAEQYNNAKIRLDEIASEIENIIEESRNITDKIDEIRSASSTVEEEATRLEGEIAVHRNSIEHNLETIARFKSDMQSATDSEQDIESQIAENEKEIEALVQKSKEKYQELSKATDSIAEFREESASVVEQSAQLSEKLSRLTMELADGRVEVSTITSSIEEIVNRISAIDETLTSRDEIISKLRENMEVCKKDLDSKNERRKALENEIAGYAMRVNTKSQKVTDLKEQNDADELEIHRINSRIKILDELEKNMEGYSGSVKAIMREKKRGTLTGIHSPLSQIINVEDKYAVAIETALGASLQHIITDTENDAKKAINYLKNNKSGRATFLPISAIKGKKLTEKDLDDCFGFVSIASDLISCDSQYYEIIVSLLGRIAVAEDIDTAITIAKKYNYHFKIVTLDGQVINAGGSMTGGSRAQSTGILTRSIEIENLLTKCNALQRKYNENSEKYEKLSQELSAAQAELSGASAELAKLQEQIIRRDGDLQLVSGQLETANSAIEELNEEKRLASERMTALENKCSSVQEKVNRLSAEKNDLQGEIEKKNIEYEAMSKKKEAMLEDESKINIEITSIQKDIEAKQEIISSLKFRLESHDNRLSVLNSEIAKINDKNKEIEKDIADLQDKIFELRKQNEDSATAVEELITKRNELDKNAATLRTEERDLSSDRENLGGELARLEERKENMEKELDSTVNKLFDEYQLTRREADELNIVIEDFAAAKTRLNELKNKIRGLGSVNVGAIEEYKEVNERYVFMGGQLDDIEKSRAELDRLISDLTQKMAEQFREQFAKISKNFSETFVELFNGGKAELSLENPLDVLESNIEIKVQPPGKNVQNIDLLSGGEKGLAAIALLFSILKVTPAPFCIFDEVEAALDDINVTRYAQYVRRMTDNTQFIVISHRRGTMEEADVLYGVTMQEKGVSKLLELKTAEMARKLGLS